MPRIQLREEIVDNKIHKVIYLDYKKFFDIDLDYYMGYRRDNTNDICNALSDRLGYNVTPKQLNTALMIEYISDEGED